MDSTVVRISVYEYSVLQFFLTIDAIRYLLLIAVLAV